MSVIGTNKNFTSKELDQFYTNPIISDELVEILFQIMPSLRESTFLEPSAGTGNFVNSLVKNGIKKAKISAMDIDPKDPFIKKVDYLKTKLKFSKQRTIIGNPPFGARGSLALKFLNKSLTEANVVAMIFPNTFNRFMIHKNVLPEAKLVYAEQLQENSFILNDKEYGVKCVFQVWISPSLKLSTQDLRIKTAPKIRHLDFQTWIHNNTDNTLKYFDKKKYGWDFAIVRQGYYDYSKKITNPNELIKNRQYFFVKYNNDEAKEIINKIDFAKLANLNTQVLGFSTSDFVREYERLKEKIC